MTAEQLSAERLEELLSMAKFSSRMMLTSDEVTSLISRVIAAEKFCKAAEKVANMDDATRSFDAAMEELTERAIEYREASK